MGILYRYEEMLKKISEENSARVAEVHIEASKKLVFQLETRFKTSIEEYVARLESSKELTHIEGDEYPCRWIRFDASQYIDKDSALERELFDQYLSDQYCINVNYKDDCLTTSDGPCLIINDDGDILDQDSGKWVIAVSEYTDDDGGKNNLKRNKLIEEWMERKGYFPSVIREDQHGNMFYVSTQDKED